MKENEEILQTQPAAPAEEITEGGKVNKLYNVITLAYGAILLFAQLYLFVALFVGIAAVNGTPLSATGLIGFFRTIGFRSFTASLPTLVPLAVFAVLWIILLITVIITSVKSIIAFLKFIRLDAEYAERAAQFTKYSCAISKSYGNAIMFIAGSLIVTPAFTAAGTGVAVLGSIIYGCNTALCVCGGLIQRESEKFDWFRFATDLAGKLIIFMLCCLAVSGIKESLNVALENFVNVNFISFNEDIMTVCSIYFNALRPMLSVVPYILAVCIAGTAMKYYPLSGGKKDVNGELKKLFITLLVFTVILAVADGIAYGKFYGSDGCAGYVADNWLGYLFASISGIILCQVFLHKKEEVI